MSVPAPSPKLAYAQALQRGFQPDPAQRHAVEVLEQCYQALQRDDRRPVTGVYLWGPVGRGKTWLMDSFQRSLQVPSRRQHFHHFMRWVHQRLFQLHGSVDPLDRLAEQLAQEVRVLCLDEFFVSDIGDAMILGRLVRQLFAQGVVLVTTSNQPPGQLYADGFNRDRFLPAILALETHLQVVPVAGPEDHRLHPGERISRYRVCAAGAPSMMAAQFAALDDGPVSTEPLSLNGRRIEVVQRSHSVLWCRYAQLCEAPLAASDYIELCDRYRHLLVSAIPRLGAAASAVAIARGTEDGVQRVAAGDRVLPKQSKLDNGVRRFIALVDECYDRGVPLWLEAQVALGDLYSEGALSFAFRRTLSRLQEMQFSRFGGC